MFSFVSWAVRLPLSPRLPGVTPSHQQQWLPSVSVPQGGVLLGEGRDLLGLAEGREKEAGQGRWKRRMDLDRGSFWLMDGWWELVRSAGGWWEEIEKSGPWLSLQEKALE